MRATDGCRDHRRRAGRAVRRVRMRHARPRLPCHRRARHAGRAMRARSIRKSRSTTFPAIRRSTPPTLIDAARRTGRAVRAGLSSRPARRRGWTRCAGGGFRLEHRRGAAIERRRAVIVAAGVGAFGPNRPPLDGIEAFEGKSVFYLVHAARGVPRPARRHRRRRRFGGRLGAVARRGRGAGDGGASPRQIPRRARIGGAARSASPKPARSSWSSPISSTGSKARTGSLRAVIVADLDGNDAAARGRSCCCRSSACRRISGRSRNGAWRSTTTTSRSIRRPAPPRAPGIFAIGDIADLSRQAEADPLGLCRGGARRACDPPAGPSRRGAAFRIFDDEGRAGQLVDRPDSGFQAARRRRRGGARSGRWQRDRGARCPGSIRASTRPPCSSMRLLTSDRPRPAPDSGALRVAALEFLEDARLVVGRYADAGIGDDRAARARRPRAAPRAGSLPPAGVNLIAFEMRLNSACFRRRSSASIVPISAGNRSDRSRSWLRARSRVKVSTLAACRWMSTGRVSSAM